MSRIAIATGSRLDVGTLARIGQRPWTPAAITTEAWFDAQDADTITIQTGVSQWDDKSGNARHAVQNNGSKQPTYNASDATMNGYPTLGNDVTKRKLKTDLTFSAKRSYFVTVNTNATFASSDILIEVDGGGRWGGWSTTDYLQSNGSDFIYKDGNTNLNYASNLDFPNGKYPVLPMSPSLWMNEWTSESVTEWHILGGDQSNEAWIQASVGEVIMTDGTEDLATQQKLEGYLAWKWGTEANLPSGHPYEFTAPLE